MPTVSAFRGVLVCMWFADHPPPHFHAKHGEYQIKMSIDTLDVVTGKMPRQPLRHVREWAFAHRAELTDNWRRARAGEPLLPIDPLP